MPQMSEEYKRKIQATEFDVGQIIITDNYAVRELNETIFVNTDGGDITITLGSFFEDKKKVRIKNIGSGKVIIVDENEETLYTLNTIQSRIEFEFNSGTWYYF